MNRSNEGNPLTGGVAARHAAMTGQRGDALVGQMTPPAAIGPAHPRDNGRTTGPTAGMAKAPGVDNQIAGSQFGPGPIDKERLAYEMWGRGTMAPTGPRPPRPESMGPEPSPMSRGLPGKSAPSPPNTGGGGGGGSIQDRIAAGGQQGPAPAGANPGPASPAQSLPSKSSAGGGQTGGTVGPATTIQQAPATPAAGQSVK